MCLFIWNSNNGEGWNFASLANFPRAWPPLTALSKCNNIQVPVARGRTNESSVKNSALAWSSQATAGPPLSRCQALEKR